MKPDPDGFAAALAGQVEQYGPPMLQLMSAAELQKRQFSPLQWIVPGLIPEGLVLLAGKPKLGKSFLVLDLALAVAGALQAMGGIACPVSKVLYCAMEDGYRRLQSRIAEMLPAGAAFPERLDLALEMKRLGKGGEEQLEAWLEAHHGARLIIIDTWRCIKPESDNRRSSYDEDAAGMQRLHAITKRWPGLCILVVHHTRKLDADDPMDMISGTTGLMGVPDTLMVLARHGEGAKLISVSREMEAYDKALKRNPETNGWTLLGDSKSLAATAERQAVLEALLEMGDSGATSRHLADELDKPEPSVRRMLNRMVRAGELRRLARGRFACPNSPKVPIPTDAAHDVWDNETNGTGLFEHDNDFDDGND